MDVADEKKRVGPSEFLLLRGVGAVRAGGGGRRVPAKGKMARLSQKDMMAQRFGCHHPMRFPAPEAHH